MALIPQSIVDEAKEAFGQRAIPIIVEDLKIQDFDERALKGCCPFHHESTPSFVWNNEGNYFRCFGECGLNYGYIDHLIGFYKMTYVEAVEKLLSEVGSDYRIVEKGMRIDRAYKYPDHVQSENRDVVEKYMNQRKISPETLDYCDVQQSDDGNNNIVFHYYDENDVLAVVKYRPSRKIPKGDIKTWCQKDRDTKNILFNMNKTDPSKPLIITEGECFRGDTEILTRNGWIRLDKYYSKAVNAADRQVMQVDMSLTGRFVEPIAFIKKSINGKISSYESTAQRSFDTNILQSTPKHNIISITPNGNLIKQKMSSLKERVNPISIPQSVVANGKGLSYTKSQLSLQIAVIGSSALFDKRASRTYCRYYHYGSQRRYDYMKQLLTELDIDYFEVTDPSVTKIPYIGFIKPDYIYDELPMRFAVDATLKEKQSIIQLLLKWECRHQNGVRNMEIFIQNDKNAEVIDTLLHLTGMNARISKKGNFNRILIQAKNATGNMPREYKEYDYNGRVYCVAVPSGMILIRQNGTIFVCGNCDALAVIESGFKNVVSVPFGAGNEKWIDTNWDFLEQFEKIIIWSDNDEPGLKLRRNACSRLGAWKTYYIDLPKEIDGIKVKDANEVLFNFGKQKVLDVIDEVKEYPIKDVVDLADVVEYDIESAQGLYSGFHELDDYIYKFFMGTLCIVTGVNSSGKSVLLNQMCICEPLNQGFDSFIFSGELSHPQLKNWIELVMAGTENIKVKDQHIRQIDKECLEGLRQWYRGRIWVYDNDIDYSSEAILGKMEELARKKGVKVFTIDNLMTVDLKCGQDNIYQKQKEFALKLVNFANKFNVLVFLVAHPRKFDTTRRITKMDISGSSDLMNLAHYIISTHRYSRKEKEGIQDWRTGEYTKGNEPEEHDVVIDLHKNRLMGIQDKEVKLYFDNPSYRFWSIPEELHKRYKWNKTKKPVLTHNPRPVEKPELIA